jgi:hypothetical protein
MQSYYEAIYNNFDLFHEATSMLNEQYLLINVDHDKMQSFKVLLKQHQNLFKIKQSNIIQN